MSSGFHNMDTDSAFSYLHVYYVSDLTSSVTLAHAIHFDQPSMELINRCIYVRYSISSCSSSLIRPVYFIHISQINSIYRMAAAHLFANSCQSTTLRSCVPVALLPHLADVCCFVFQWNTRRQFQSQSSHAANSFISVTRCRLRGRGCDWEFAHEGRGAHSVFQKSKKIL